MRVSRVTLIDCSYGVCETAVRMLNWVNWTPLGSPVVPEEHRIRATVSWMFVGGGGRKEPFGTAALFRNSSLDT